MLLIGAQEPCRLRRKAEKHWCKKGLCTGCTGQRDSISPLSSAAQSPSLSLSILINKKLTTSKGTQFHFLAMLPENSHAEPKCAKLVRGSSVYIIFIESSNGLQRAPKEWWQWTTQVRDWTAGAATWVGWQEWMPKDFLLGTQTTNSQGKLREGGPHILTRSMDRSCKMPSCYLCHQKSSMVKRRPEC